MDDDTASSGVAIHRCQWNVQTVNGVVERGGNVWVPGVPLPLGTNNLTLMATDAAGNGPPQLQRRPEQRGPDATPLSQDALQYGYATISVIVGATASAVTVNGVAGTSSDGLNWTVANVPLPPGGTVPLQVTAQLAGGTTVQTLVTQERGPIVFTQSFSYNLDYSFLVMTPTATNGSPTFQNNFQWTRGLGGTNTEIDVSVDFNTHITLRSTVVTVWPADNGYLPTLPGQEVITSYQDDQLMGIYTNTADPPDVQWMEESTSDGTWPDNFDVSWAESSSREVRLFTGGDAERQSQGLFDLSAPLGYATCLREDVQVLGFAIPDGGLPESYRPAHTRAPPTDHSRRVGKARQ